MAAIPTMKVTIFRVERLGNSTNGNPTWLLRTDNGEYRTQTDSSVGYEISDSWRDLDAKLHLTRAGRVWRINKL